MHVGCAKGRVGGCGGSNAPPEAKSSTSRRIAQRIRREVELLGLARTPGLAVDDLSSDRPKGALGSRHRARPRHFAQQTRRRHRVTAGRRRCPGRWPGDLSTRYPDHRGHPTDRRGANDVARSREPASSDTRGHTGPRPGSPHRPGSRLGASRPAPAPVRSDGCFSAKWMQTSPISNLQSPAAGGVGVR